MACAIRLIAGGIAGAGVDPLKQTPPPFPPTTPIAVKGRCIGTAREHQLRVVFVALDARVSDMDGSIWPTAEYADRAASQMLKTSG